MILLCIAASVWAATEGFLYLGLSINVNILITHLQYLGIAPLPPLALLFSISFFGYASSITRMRLNLLLIISAAIILLVWSNSFHHLVFEGFYSIDNGMFTMLGLKHGILWRVILAYHYFLLAALSFLLIFMAITSTGVYRSLAMIFLLAVASVWVANGIYVTGNSPVSNMDISPIAFTGVAGVMAWGFFRYKLLDILPVARAEIFYRFENAILVLDRKHRVLDMNLAAEYLFDVSLKKALGLNARQVLSAFPQLCDLLFETGMNGVCMSISSKERVYDINVSIIKDRKKVFQGSTLTLRDVTERKQAEEALSHSKEKYQALSKMLRLMCDNVPDMIWAKDLETRYIFANKAVCQNLLGAKDTTEPIGKTSMFFAKRERVSHPDDPDWHTFGEICQDSDKIVMKTKVPGHFEEYGNVKGTFLYLDVHKAAFFSEKGEIIGTVGCARDVTAHKQAEAALRESEERFRMLLNDVSMVSVQSCATDGTTLYWNEGSCRLYGYTAQEAVGKSIYDLIIPPEIHDTFAATMQRMADTRVPAPSFEIELLHKDGSRVPVYTTHCILQRPGHPLELFCVGIDLRKVRHAEQEREKLQEQLNQARKMEAIGRLAGGVAHDFNNMLGVILAQTELAMLDVAPENKLYSRLEEIRKAAERSADLTRQLLAFARKQTVAPKMLDLNETVERLLPMLRRLIGEHVNLRWQPGENLWPIRIDPSQIDQILTNLCANARDAMAAVGNVTIETGNEVLNEDQHGVCAGVAPGDYIGLAVGDDGCGMEKETVEKIFDPFFTTKKMGKGTGLGLATVYGVVTQNGGFVSVHSKPGQGTKLRILLPRHIAETKEIDLPDDAKQDESGGETILLVEDEPMILDVTTTMLEQLGYAVLAAGTPGEAVQLARAHGGQIHLLITDVVMPEMNGRELAKNILSLYPDMERLFMSGYTSDIIAHHGVLDEGVNFIQKPFTMKTLAVKLREVFAKDTAEHPGATG